MYVQGVWCEVTVEPGRTVVRAEALCAEFEIYGEAPVQGFGSVLGRELYFRARNEGWSFDVADREGRLPSDGYRDSDGFYREGAYKTASFMSREIAVKLIVSCLKEFVGST
jgi:hypothetical protein